MPRPPVQAERRRSIDINLFLGVTGCLNDVPAFLIGASILIALLVIKIASVRIVLGQQGFRLVAKSVFETTKVVAMSAVPLFILMGKSLLCSGSDHILFDSDHKLIGKFRGR